MTGDIKLDNLILKHLKSKARRRIVIGTFDIPPVPRQKIPQTHSSRRACDELLPCDPNQRRALIRHGHRYVLLELGLAPLLYVESVMDYFTEVYSYEDLREKVA